MSRSNGGGKGSTTDESRWRWKGQKQTLATSSIMRHKTEMVRRLLPDRKAPTPASGKSNVAVVSNVLLPACAVAVVTSDFFFQLYSFPVRVLVSFSKQQNDGARRASQR